MRGRSINRSYIFYIGPPFFVHDEFYQAFPALVLQATNAGVRRPGNEANNDPIQLSLRQDYGNCLIAQQRDKIIFHRSSGKTVVLVRLCVSLKCLYMNML